MSEYTAKRARFTPLATLAPEPRLTLQDVPEVDTVTLTTPLADPSLINTLPFLTTLRVDSGFLDMFLVDEPFVNALAENTTLTSLDLSRSDLSEVGGVGALKTNSSLTILNLSGNVLRDVEGVAIADLLKTNSSLTTLNLAHNELGEDAGVAIADALERNTTLTTLDLGINDLGEVGGAAVAGALERNTTLTSLNLAHNDLGDVGGAAIARALETNTTLVELNVNNNGISQPILNEIAGKLADRPPPYTGPRVKVAVPAALRANVQFWGGPGL